MTEFRITDYNNVRWGTTDNFDSLCGLAQYLVNSVDPEERLKHFTIYAHGDDNFEINLADFCEQHNIRKQSFGERMQF